MSTQAVLRRRVAATVAVALAAFGLMGATPPPDEPAAQQTCTSTHLTGPSRVGRISGIARPQAVAGHCASSSAGALSVYPGSPPLVNNGGPVMATPSAGNQVVVTPIFWAPSGYSFTASYKDVITSYLTDLAADSEKTSNVFATMFQYTGSNGAINYRMTAAAPITDTTAYPKAGCTTNSGGVYADHSGYTTCLDDNQIIAQTDAVVSGHGLARDFGHLYLMFLPKHVESCFLAGNPSSQQCTINSSPSGAYCAYHSAFNSGGETAYATMPFPIYNSPVGFSCTTEDLGGPHTIQAPNGDADADVEISPLSHEMAEAITDPNGNAWYDAAGYENGDDCAYIYGTLSGSNGGLWNQVVNGHHYLTQEEFSNADYLAGHEACLQSMPPVRPAVTGLAPATGPRTGGTTVTITGTGFPGATAVRFGGVVAAFTITDATHIKATAPAGAAGTVDVKVVTSAGASQAVATDHYTYTATGPAPTVTSVAPTSGPTGGGRTVTITGTHLTGATAVHFGTAAGTSVHVVSDTSLTVRTPQHAAARVDVTVTTPDGTSATSSADRYRFLARPRVTSVSPHSGTKAGGTLVTVVGHGFVAGATVRFGTTAGTQVKVVSATKLTVRSPKHATGRVDVTVRTGGGTSASVSADRYTFT
jgi:hypothetical protein